MIDDPTPSSPTLSKLETHPVDLTTNRPTPDIRIKDVTIFVDPFEEFLAKKRQEEQAAQGHAAGQKGDAGDEPTSRREDDDNITWTGKRIRRPGAGGGLGGGGGIDDGSSAAGVGRYLKAALVDKGTAAGGQDEDEIVEFVDDEPDPEPVRKKMKGTGGFGDFSSW